MTSENDKTVKGHLLQESSPIIDLHLKLTRGGSILLDNQHICTNQVLSQMRYIMRHYEKYITIINQRFIKKKAVTLQ